ncbi:hypothetical protein CNR22_01985 [Sphingobacteriaceae bacterium]|nr:hypothetical protein CNR22_01985 [Sphingobacteriaceae bacterium]
MRKDRIKEVFAGRKLIIATKHRKEQVISPVLNKALHVECLHDATLDTDSLGTFTGEVERLDDVLETARKKCRMAMQLSNCDMAVASEGSFGAHPTLGFMNADDELLLFMDAKNELEVVVRELSVKTNFNGQKIKTETELIDFADRAKFPSHGLILRKSATSHSEIVKGITELSVLKDVFYDFVIRFGEVYIETDMRAMYNPTRMEVIESAAKKLADKIVSFCPQCFTPGFGVTNVKAGLPCMSCGFPTRSTLFHEYRCIKCHYTEDRKYPNGKKTEEPTFCDICNP